eukprot:Clim_evm15s166 gene=Clim_evmTU15s166
MQSQKHCLASKWHQCALFEDCQVDIENMEGYSGIHVDNEVLSLLARKIESHEEALRVMAKTSQGQYQTEEDTVGHHANETSTSANHKSEDISIEELMNGR